MTDIKENSMNASIKNMIASDFGNEPVPERLKAWEVESCFKCPLVGGCLDLDEQKKLLKKMGSKEKPEKLFDIHEILVACLDGENDLSTKMDELLSRKFKKQLDEFSSLEEKDTMDQWRKRKDSSESHGIFFAVATKPNISFNSRKEIFGDVHMAMHTCAVETSSLKVILEKQKGKIREAEEKLKKETASRKAIQKEREAVKKELDKFMGLLETTEAEKLRLTEKLRCIVSEIRKSCFEDENAGLKIENGKLGQRIIESERQVIQLLAENKRLHREIEKQRENSARICCETTRIMEQISEASGCSESCPYYDLCSKRVLVIGGLTRMEALYRDMVESNGGVFDYHSGDMRNGSKDLEKSVKRADMILCPIDCNSHGACTMVKKFCKKYGKSFQMLPSSGASSVFKAIFNENTIIN